jgi:hypothetical protein
MRAVLALSLLIAATAAQDAGFEELRRWRWRTDRVLDAAWSTQADVVVLGIRLLPGPGGAVVLYDLAQRRELRRLPTPRPVVGVRFHDADHVGARMRDTDSLLSLSYWRRTRLEDGGIVGEPQLYRFAPEPDDRQPLPDGLRAAIENRLRQLVPYADGRTVLRDGAGGAWVWRADALQPVFASVPSTTGAPEAERRTGSHARTRRRRVQRGSVRAAATIRTRPCREARVGSDHQVQPT